jgi:PRTRC genetic system protein E
LACAIQQIRRNCVCRTYAPTWRTHSYYHRLSRQSKFHSRELYSFQKKEDENASLATPLSFSGAPEELDRELGSNLASYVDENLRLQSTLAEAKAEMEAAAKAARDQARAKSALNTKKHEDAAPKESMTETAKTADVNMTLFAGQQK